MVTPNFSIRCYLKGNTTCEANVENFCLLSFRSEQKIGRIQYFFKENKIVFTSYFKPKAFSIYAVYVKIKKTNFGKKWWTNISSNESVHRYSTQNPIYKNVDLGKLFRWGGGSAALRNSKSLYKNVVRESSREDEEEERRNRGRTADCALLRYGPN